MTKHSKNNTASSIFSYAEYKKLDYGTKRQRLGNESMRRFDSCALCLNRARDPVVCQEGHLFCKECVYTDLLTQKKDIKRQKERLEALKKEAEAEKAAAKQAARERVLQEFERGQLGLAAWAFDNWNQICSPDFWLPSLTPTYASSGPPQSLVDIKVQTTCRGGNPAHEALPQKSSPPVIFTTHSSGGAKSNDEEADPMCPSCKKKLSNNTLMFCAYVAKPCGHVTCKTCTETLVKPAKQCIVCDTKLKTKEIMELKREGTGFASGGLAETSRSGIAFQGIDLDLAYAPTTNNNGFRL
ncbi:hypothetical protein DFP72DRAFT_992912 [Ephemerocybe angulata]|uniref:RING-type domain-containing protein n=1 Tax=Ephemerocybe angulata TaxID=980116 RepID=A0A8H6HH15_9AGAR|nr:hypothetical protein DFP72DRAFT_992912 [Tulosesus angulatus]